MRDPRRAWSRASATGSAPPMSRCPVSRHRPMALSSRTRCTSAASSTIVPTCGCRVARDARLRRQAASRSRLPSRVDQPASSRTGRSSYPSWPVAAASTRVRGARLDEGLQRGPDRGHGVVRRVVQDHGDEAAHGMKAVVRQHFRRGARLLGQEARPARTPWRPGRPRASGRARWPTSYCHPQPGTSQTPHEIGAAAMRSAQRAGHGATSDGVHPAGLHAHDLSGADGDGMCATRPEWYRPRSCCQPFV